MDDHKHTQAGVADLERFIIDNQDLEHLESLLAEFNIFEAVGAVRQELRHSDFLGFLLDPASNHGLGDLFLKKFLMDVSNSADFPSLSPIDVDVAEWSDTEIRREWRSIDILIINHKNRFVCAIENKVRSKEHSNQTKRYRDIVNEEFPKNFAKLFVYLTPEGETSEDENWIAYSYGSIGGLVSAISQSHRSSLGPNVYAVLAHYVTMLGRHIVRDSEIAELCRKIYYRHKNALDLIYEHRPDLQSELAEVIKDVVSESSHEGAIICRFAKSFVRFVDSTWDNIPALQEGTGRPETNLILTYEFQNRPSSLILALHICPGPQEIREKIYKTARKNPQVFKGVGKRQYPKWTQLYKLQILKASDYDTPDFDDLVKVINAKWKTFVEKDFLQIRKAIEEIKW